MARRSAGATSLFLACGGAAIGQRGFGPDRKAGLRGLPARRGRRVQLAIQSAHGISRRQGRRALLSARCHGPHPVRSRGGAFSANLFDYVSTWKPAPARRVVYAGDPAGTGYLQSSGISVAAYQSKALTPEQVLVVGPGGGLALSADATAIAEWLKAGGHLLAIGLDDRDANAFLPFQITTRNTEHIATWFYPFESGSCFAGIGPADVYSRDPRDLPLLTAALCSIGDGVLATSGGTNVVFCQLVPWQFDPAGKPNVKRTFRRTSFLVSRLLANLGVATATPILDRFSSPVAAAPERPGPMVFISISRKNGTIRIASSAGERGATIAGAMLLPLVFSTAFELALLEIGAARRFVDPSLEARKALSLT